MEAEIHNDERSTDSSNSCNFELISDEPGVTENLRRGEARSFEHLGRLFLEQFVRGGLIQQNSASYNRRRAELSQIRGNRGRFKEYCRADSLSVNSAGAFLCRFGNQTTSASLRVENWTLVRPQGSKAVAWLVLDQAAAGSKYGSSEVRSRRASSLPNFPEASWVEMSHTVEDRSALQTGDTADHVVVNTQWNGYAVKSTTDTLQALAYKIPIMQKRTSGSIIETQTQIDVAFPRPGIMEVTARTDSLSEEQRCWLGTHVIDSTAAGLR